MKRKGAVLLALILCLSMILSMAPQASAATGDEVRAARKIISVVYDDSGSMFGERWVYANYAMQALTALLNEQDSLYLTYMSSPDVARSVDLTNIEGAVAGVRAWTDNGGTPGMALDTAKQALDGVSESDTAAQFWLVIFTDGEIDMSSSIQDKLNSFRGAQMSNGSRLNVVYCAMGSGAVAANDDTKNGLYTYLAESDSEITRAMSDIANIISGRLNADKVAQVDDTTISFQSELPLYSICVLAQQSSALVVEAKTQEQALDINRNIGLDAWEPFGNTSTQLYGNAAVVNLAGNVIPAGSYTITFSEPVDVSNLLVQYEPAIGIKMVITRDGIEITDPSLLQPEDKIDIELIPVIPGTDQRISDSSLPAGTSWQIEYIVDGTEADSGTGKKLSGIELLIGNGTLRGTMQIPGFAPSVYDQYLQLDEIVYDFSIQRQQPDPLVFGRTGAPQTDGELTFHIANQGTPLTKEQQKKLGLKLEIASVDCDNSKVEGFFNRFGKTLARCNLKLNDDGSYTLTPAPVIPFTAFLTMAGDYTVTVCLASDTGITQTGTFTMIAQPEDWFDLIKLVISLLILIYLIFIIFIKHKFKGQTVSYQAYKLRSDGSGTKLINDVDSKQLTPWMGLFSLKRASEYTYRGMTLQAGPDGIVIVTGKSIGKRVHAYKTTSMNPERSLRTILSTMQPTKRTVGKKTEVCATDQLLSKTQPVYFRSYETDKIIWSLSLR